MDDRGVSTVVSYILALGIVTILVSTLIVSFAPFVTNQQEATAQSTMEVFGNDLAGDIESVDRLAMKAGTDGTVELRTRLPTRVGGSTYEIELVNASDGPRIYEIRLTADDFQATALVILRTRLPIEERAGNDALDGGNLRIYYDPNSGELVIRNV
jgi:hypothetical protein